MGLPSERLSLASQDLIDKALIEAILNGPSRDRLSRLLEFTLHLCRRFHLRVPFPCNGPRLGGMVAQMGNSATGTIENRAVGERLATMRRKLGLSQRDFAERLGVSVRAYQNYERGEREVSATLIRALYKTFRIEPSWIFEGDNVPDVATKGSGAITIDKDLFLLVLQEIEDYLLQNRLDARVVEGTGRLAFIIYGRVADAEPAKVRHAISREVQQVFEILKSAQRRTPSKAAKVKFTRLLDQWVKLEVKSQLMFVKVASHYEPSIARHLAKDLGNKYNLTVKAQWTLREQLLLERLIGYDAHSVEHCVPLDQASCVTWLENECEKRHLFLKEMRDLLRPEKAALNSQKSREGKSKKAA